MKRKGKIGPSNEIRLTMTEAAVNQIREHAVEQAIEVLRRRIDESGIREPTIQQEGEDRIVVQVPGLDNPEELKKLLGQTAKMTFHLVDVSVVPKPGMRPPPGTELLPDEANPNQLYVVQRRVMVSGIVDAADIRKPKLHQVHIQRAAGVVGQLKGKQLCLCGRTEVFECIRFLPGGVVGQPDRRRNRKLKS